VAGSCLPPLAPELPDDEEPDDALDWPGGELESGGEELLEPLEPLDELEPLELLEPLLPDLWPLDPLPPNGSLYWSSPALWAQAAAGKANAVVAASNATLRRGAVTAAQASQRGGA
jgi:hypothetical protein